ncbi:MAG: hypothetical protein KIS94_07020 [Chitinophagales bacterium]|nr:hypothetical protein [Chitinophagales bacterium]
MILRNVIVTLFWFLLLNFAVYRFAFLQLIHFRKWVSLLVFNAKFAAGILIWAVYTFYYTDTANNDVHKFYNDALVLNSAAAQTQAFTKLMLGKEDETTESYTVAMKNWNRHFDEAPINENRTIIRLHALLMFLSFRSYFVHILFMCLISLLGWVLLTNSIMKNANQNTVLLALPVLLLPSVLFWTSGIMKEPVLVLGIGLFVCGLLHSVTWKQLALLVTGVLIILSSKFYVLACLLPSAVTFLAFRNNANMRAVAAKYAVTVLILIATVFVVEKFSPSSNPVQMLVNKQTHSIKEAAYFDAGSRIDIPTFTNTASIVKAIPAGVWNSLVRPYLWEIKNPLMLAAALENLMVLLLLAYCAWNVYRVAAVKLNLLLFLLFSSLWYFALVGISTPVIGNLVRYKTPLLPLFIYAFLLLGNFKHMPRSLQQLLLKEGGCKE